ncbi:unnamed protein product [Parnassius apollo]|uniref:(apollo) hypothetical protein n=1 Tax=Parnassius apollo TaxID=110799 RepID=A0A8S3WNR3_PARAO|nr:unnamed protein product [Parnassius apollo]
MGCHNKSCVQVSIRGHWAEQTDRVNALRRSSVADSAVGMGRSPQGSAWWCLSPRVRKELLLLGIGMSRSYELYAGPFFSLNLPSFIQIVRTAYSFYAVLRQKSG